MLHSWPEEEDDVQPLNDSKRETKTVKVKFEPRERSRVLTSLFERDSWGSIRCVRAQSLLLRYLYDYTRTQMSAAAVFVASNLHFS